MNICRKVYITEGDVLDLEEAMKFLKENSFNKPVYQHLEILVKDFREEIDYWKQENQ